MAEAMKDVLVLSGKQLKCTVCNCLLPSTAEKFVESHLNGKKHKLQQERNIAKEHKLKHSVYIKGFDPSLTSLEEDLHNLFEEIGGEIKDIYIDKNTGSYCIIEFEQLPSVFKAVSSDMKTFHGKKLIVRPREVSKKSSDDVTKATVTDKVESSTMLLPVELRDLLNDKIDINQQMNILRNYIQLSQEEMEMRTLICQLLETVLEEVYPECKVKSFGSSVNGLGVKDCDLDVTLLLSETTEDCDENDGIMKHVREVLERFAPGFKNVLLVESAKNCSIVKLYHTQSNLNVDLSFNNRLALENTSLLKYYINNDDHLLDLFFTLRYWGKLHGLSGRSGVQVSNYALTLMIIHYLQQLDPPYLMCLQTCHEILPRVCINQWDCSFCKTHSQINGNLKNTGELLFGFFDFYGRYSFNKRIICIHTVQELNRSDCIKELNSTTGLVVRDPFKLSHNVAHNMTESGLNSFQTLCKEISEAFRSSKQVTLQSIFYKKKEVRQRPKQKRKRNRSNVYTISLPNCSHMIKGTNSRPCCYVYTETLLLDNLKMEVDDITESKPNSLLDILSIKQKIEAEEKEKEELNNVNSKKRKLDDESLFCEVTNKKLKTDDCLFLEFVARAYNETWTSRRKERRHLLKQTASTSEVKYNDTNCDAAMDKNGSEMDNTVSMETSKSNNVCKVEQKFTINNIIEEPNVDEITIRKPKLCVKVQVHRAVDETCVCKVILEPVDDRGMVTSVEDFQIFYAYFKKELVSVFK